MMRLLIIWLLLCLFAPGLLAADQKKKGPDDIGNSDPGKGVNFYSIEKEIAMGKQIAQEVEREAKLLQDPVVTEYVNRLGQNLARNSDVQVPITVKVIDSSAVNAFALPGGFMFVNTGLVLRAGNEAELASVMAHEIAHVAARHGTKQASRGQIANIASIPLIFLGGWAGFGARQAAGLAVPLGFLKYSRGMEEEADRLGVEYMYKAGYDPTAFVDFFERIESLEKKKPGTISKIFSSHPPTEDRIERTQKQLQEGLQPLPQYVVDTSEFRDVRERLARLENRRQVDPEDDKRPTLRRRTSDKVDQNGDTKSDDDERPTLKRRG
jgi:predicted Zn-dependent protease